MLWHFEQNWISLLIFATVSEKNETSSFGLFTRCKTKRKAVFFPMPGNLANSLTACSSKVEEKDIAQK
jgi:hypothetical protein